MFGDPLWQCFYLINGSSLLKTFLKGLESNKTEEVNLRDFSFQIFFCHNCVGFNQGRVACEKRQRVLLVKSSLLTANLLVCIFREPDPVHVILISGQSREKHGSREPHTRVFLVMLDCSMQSRVSTIIVVVVKDGLTRFRNIREVQIRTFWPNKGSRCWKFIFNNGWVSKLVEEVWEIVSSLELINHLELSEGYPLEWCRFVEAEEIVIALAVKPFDLREHYSEHRERV